MEASALSKKDFQSELKPIWCPGCGDFGVVSSFYQAFANFGTPPHEVAFLSGIGCSSRIPGYTTAYGFNSVHGRSLPMAIGVKIANPKLTVVAAGGDGDGFSIGGGHVPHAVRRNVDITYVVMDNQIYGLTKGQASPTTDTDTVTVTTPYGLVESPIRPVVQVLAYGAGFVAQGSSSDLKTLAKLIEEGMRYKGFAFINVQSPCVTYGEEHNQVKSLRERVVSLDAIGHDPSNKMEAYRLAEEQNGKIYQGVFYRAERLPQMEYAELHAKRAEAAQQTGTYPVEKIFERNFLVS
ncbi:MAG: thiamine pyrophosphate-dependent enzyme [Myxococcota bacterium]